MCHMNMMFNTSSTQRPEGRTGSLQPELSSGGSDQCSEILTNLVKLNLISSTGADWQSYSLQATTGRPVALVASSFLNKHLPDSSAIPSK